MGVSSEGRFGWKQAARPVCRIAMMTGTSSAFSLTSYPSFHLLPLSLCKRWLPCSLETRRGIEPPRDQSQVLTGSLYAALADTAAASLFFFAGKSGRRDSSKVSSGRGWRSGPQDGGRPFLDAAQRLADEEALRLSLLLRLLPLPGFLDAALCLALGGLQTRPAQFAAGALTRSYRHASSDEARTPGGLLEILPGICGCLRPSERLMSFEACLGTLANEKVQAP